MSAWLIIMAILLNPGCETCGCGSLSRVYVGGTFTTIGGASKARLALIDRNGVAVSGFAADLDAQPNALYVDEVNQMLWVGGDFTTINGVGQAALAALDLNTGAVLYAPTLSGNFAGLTTVYGFYADPNSNWLYVNGDFTNVNGTACTGAVRLNRGASPTLNTAWLPVLDGLSQHANVLGSTVYLAGGGFTLVNGSARAGAGAVDDVTGTATTAWNPNVTGGVVDLIVRSTVSAFIVGNFARVNGAAGTLRRNLAEVDAVVGTCTSWDPGANILNDRGTMLASGGSLSFFCVGPFTTVAGGVAVRSVAEFLDAGALDASFRPALVADRCDQAHLGVNGRLYVCMGGGGDYGVFSLSVVDGSTYQDWLPSANSDCTCVTTSTIPL